MFTTSATFLVPVLLQDQSPSFNFLLKVLMVNPSLLESIFRLIFFLSSLRDFEQYLTFFEGKNSSLNFDIWRSFCSFWYSRTYQ